MIVKIIGNRIQNVEISTGFKILKSGERFVPDDWGTDEILGLIFDDDYRPVDFSIRENPDVKFRLFDVFNVPDKKPKFKIGKNPDSPIFLFDILESDEGLL